jgi:hypothetical protein
VSNPSFSFDVVGLEKSKKAGRNPSPSVLYTHIQVLQDSGQNDFFEFQ